MLVAGLMPSHPPALVLSSTLQNESRFNYGHRNPHHPASPRRSRHYVPFALPLAQPHRKGSGSKGGVSSDYSQSPPFAVIVKVDGEPATIDCLVSEPDALSIVEEINGDVALGGLRAWAVRVDAVAFNPPIDLARRLRHEELARAATAERKANIAERRKRNRCRQSA